MDIGGFDLIADEFGDNFSLADGDKAPFQQMTFTLSDEQAEHNSCTNLYREHNRILNHHSRIQLHE